jgi:Ca2+-binding EF-hand superfamily protein
MAGHNADDLIAEIQQGSNKAEDQIAELAPEVIAGLKQIFDKFDKDGSGEIDVSEAGNLLEELGQDNSPEAVQKFVTWLDEDRSGKVEFQEFLNWFKTL